MRFKPKTVRRLLLVAVVVVVLVGTVFSLFVVRRWQTNRRTEAHRRDGMAALAAGQYRKTIDELDRYVHRGRTQDAEVWLALAQATQAIETPDYGHLRAAIRSLQQYLALRPDDAAQRLALLKLCNQAGMWVEARDAAARLRPSDVSSAGPEHIEVLREEAIALAAARIYGERLDTVVDRLIALEPLDLQAHLIRLEFWGRTDRKQDARRGAQALAAAHPNDPVAQLIFAASYLLEPTADDVRIARGKIAQAAGFDVLTGASTVNVVYPSADFASRAVDILDRLQAFDLSFAVLQRWREQRPGPPRDRLELGLLRTLARRLWQQSDVSGVAALVPEESLGSSDSEVLAFRAMAFFQSGDPSRREAAERVVKLLESRSDDFRAVAWVKVLPLADPARASDPRANVETLRTVIKSTSRAEPVYLAILGDAYAALSRFDDAREAWKAAAESPVCASWPYPHIRQAETHLAEGHANDAVTAATQALMVARNSPAVNALWFEAQAAKVQSVPAGSEDPNPAAILQTLERVNEQVQAAGTDPEVRVIWERLLPSRVLFLARSGQGERAIALARSALGDSTPLAERTLQKLANVSVSERLGFEQECLARAGSAAAAPAVALTRAMELARAGKPDEGLAVVREAASNERPDSWLALAQYLEHINHAESLEAWVRVGDRFKEDIAVQRACLASGAAAGDAAFIERTITRYQQLAGLERAAAEDAVVRIARARVLLRGSAGGLTLKDRDSAVAMLAQVVAAQPRLVEPKIMLARALLLSDPRRSIRPDEPRAASQLSDALAVEPRSATIALELAMVHQRMREFDRARELLTRIASDSAADPQARHAASRMLMAQGGNHSAVALATLEDLDRRWQERRQSTPLHIMVDLADAYLRAQREKQAGEIYARIAADPAATADHLYLAARFHQRRSDEPGLRSVLTRLDSGSLGLGAAASVRARLAEDRNDLGEADRLFEEAVTADPKSSGAWRAYVSSLLARNRGQDAAATALRAASALPEDPSLKLLLEQARLASVPSDGVADFAPVIAAMAKDPSMAGATEILRALDDARLRGDLDRPERVLDLADQFPGVVGLQVYLAQRLVPIDPEMAVLLIGRARSLAPGDASTAKAAAEVFLSLGRWNDLVAAATAWREADGGRSAEPDVAIAQARFNLNDHAGGLAALERWVPTARSNPESPMSLPVLNVQTRLLIASGQAEKARELLAPLLQTSASVRTAIWLRAAAESLPDLATARAWIDQVRPSIPQDSASEQGALAGALSMLSSRFPKSSSVLLTEAKSGLVEFAQRAQPAPASIWEALGVVCHRQNDLPAAREAYERALATEPRRPISLNNLASLLLDQGADLEAALALAMRSVDVSAEPASLTTLGSIKHAIAMRDRGRGGDAQSSFKSAAEAFDRVAKLKPRDPQALSRAAESAADAGDFRAAAAGWERLIALPGLNPEGLAGVKNNLAATLLRMEPGAEDVLRARALVMEAIAVTDNPAFHDTLGWIELQAGRRDRAVEVFRKAVGSMRAEDRRPSVVIGLATALAGGTAEERKEAAQISSTVEPKSLDPFLREKFERMRAMVQVDKP